jgi:hypothetical protein
VGVQIKSLRCSELEGLGVRYLHVDSSIDCDSPEYEGFVSNVAWLLILYLFVPLVYFRMVYRVCDRLHPRQSGGDDAQNKLEGAALRLHEDGDPELRPVKFLYKGYRPSLWYWEVIESYRRIFLMSTLFIIDSPVKRAFLGATGAFISLSASREIGPYSQSTSNMLNMAVQYQTFFVSY